MQHRTKEGEKKTGRKQRDKRKLVSHYPADQRQIQEVNPRHLVPNMLFHVIIEVTNLSQSVFFPPREASRIYLAKTIPAPENCVQHPA